MLRTGALFLTTLLLGISSHGASALELKDCRISAGQAFPGIKARCGTLERRENPDDPESPLLAIRVAVVPALNLQPQPDPIVPLAGGPGQGAVQFYSAFAAAFERLRSDHDILLVDQRGTGESARLDCPVDDEIVTGQYSVERTVALMKECLAQLPYDPRYFTTSIAVQDLEAVREALGYSRLNLYGVSYGSRVAQHYAKRYPAATRTIVLDGVVPPQLALGPGIATEAQKALDNIFARCAADTACNDRYPGIAAAFVDLKNKLDKQPEKVSVADPVTGHVEVVSFGRQELAGAIRLLAYSPNSIAMLPLLVSEAANGNYQPLAAQFQMTLMSIVDAIALGMHNAIMCTEDVPFYDASSIDRAALEASYMGPVQLDALEAICSVWPAGPIDEDFKQALSTEIPTLLLSGSVDPITPPRYADMAARNLKKAWLLTGENQGHGQIAVGCMPRIVERFVDKMLLTPEDYACFTSSFVMPFFLGFSEPQP